MLFFLTRHAARETTATLLEEWQPELREVLAPVSYEELAQRRTLEPGAYLFTDTERCSPAVVAALGRLAARIESAAPRARVLNDPRRVLLRAELIPRLFAMGEVSYTVHRLGTALGGAAPVRYPVILRQDRGHRGALTGPLPDLGALQRAVLAACLRGFSPHRLLVSEFVATADARGRVPLRQAYIIGGDGVAAYAGWAPHWEARFAFPDDAEGLRLLRTFLAENPHRAWLARVAATAGIDFGRVDYGLRDGRPELWEVNTNPVFAYPKAKCPGYWLELQGVTMARFAELCRAWSLPPSGPEIDAAAELATLAALLGPPPPSGSARRAPNLRERLRRSQRLAAWLGQRPVRGQRRP